MQFTGEHGPVKAGISLKATDSFGAIVIVMATKEVVQQYGLYSVHLVASDKYDSGQVESDGSVLVQMVDFLHKPHQ